jgi:L-aminopeptidase/D-esterase-like protein
MNRRSFATTMLGASAFARIARLPRQDRADFGITAIDGIRVGHYTYMERPTGCTVLLTEVGATGGVDVRGSAPGTRETDLLDPVNMVQQVHAIVLSGGSAFGLDSASGVVRYLRERNIGFPTRAANVPIVPAAILYDLNIGDSTITPDADAGYRACLAATTGALAEGNIGAGAGATVGKSMGGGRAMKGGLGTSSFRTPDGVVVGALVAVNCVGNVVDPSNGTIVAGARDGNGGFIDTRQMATLGQEPQIALGEATTIGVVATNAAFTKAEVTKIAQMAQDGLARTIYPAHTMGDGDTVFAVATGTAEVDGNLGLVGALGAEVMADAILRAVRAAESIPGYPAARDYPEN